MIELRKPRVTAKPGRWTIDFGDSKGLITSLPKGGFSWWWHSGNGGSVGETARWDTAFATIWGRAARQELPPTLDVPEFQLARWSIRAEADVGEAAKLVREVLELRTGIRWSVRRGRGKSREKLMIKAPTSRLVNGMMTCHDAAVLAALLELDLVNRRHGATIGSTVGDRTDALCLIAGLPAVDFAYLRRSKCAT